MKRVFILGLGVALVAGGMTSCRKTSKGKMSNEWTVSDYNSESTSTSVSGDVYKTVQVMDGTSLVSTYTTSPNGGSVSSSESRTRINSWTYTIDKDGTWNSLKNTTRTNLSSNETDNTIKDYSGVWNFIGKSKTEEFKMNERVIFNILDLKITETYTVGNSAPIVSTDIYTLSNDDDAYIIYTVVESKGKKLTLESENTSSNTDSYGTSSSTGLTTISFTQE
jgi:hypothetical protein